MQEVDHQKAMELLNNSLKEMKGGLTEVDKMKLKDEKKSMAEHMHNIYDKLTILVEKYDVSDSHEDLNTAFRQLEILKPSFILNYNEILK